MRHIPEEELHAYLDQALSRSQCVEIEQHLARCGRCQQQRDDIAALRDRTTALLARIGPPPIIPPAFTTLQARAVDRYSRQTPRRAWLAAAVAASVAGAAVLGWQLTHRATATTPSQIVIAPEVEPLPPITGGEPVFAPVHAAPKGRPAPVQRPVAPAPRQLVRASRPVGDAAPAVTDFANAIETDSIQGHPVAQLALVPQPLDFDDLATQPVSADPGLQGLWRTIIPDSDAPEESTDIALVPGLPVMQMRQQPGSGTSDVTAVDQLLDSGEVIRTIAGPVTRVLSLVDEDARAESPGAAHGSSDRMTVTIRQGDRMVAVTGPSQALGSLLARVNMKNTKRRY